VLEKIVFLADKIAYDPKSPHGGEYVPALLAVQSLDEAVLVYLDFLLDNAWRYAWFLHPHAVAAYRELAGQSMKVSLPQPARIVRVIDESPKVRTLLLDLHLEAEPGQFVMAWLPGLDEKPFSLVCAEPVTLTVARVGPFSTAMHALEVGNPIWIRGPLGQGFTLAEPQGALLLLGGGYGVAPIYFLAERALAHGCEVSMVIGARTSADVVFADRFRSLGVQVVVATDDGSLGRQGLATDAAERLLEQAGYQAIYACGPEPMLEAVASLAETHHLPAQLSYERYMRCGFGVCGSCVHQGWLVCRDGPVRYVGRGVQHVEHG
jgi:dihydroorotate dehydrogenase electron transfer subunit